MNGLPTIQTTPHRRFSKNSPEHLAGVVFFSWIIVLLAFDLLTLRWFPVPWNDEVLFADPAASLLLHGHWTSTIWYGRSDFTWWGGNVPAYSLLLVPWLWLWGVSAPAVRSLNCVLIALTMVCTWFSVKRLNLIPSPKIRLATLVALSLCYPVSYCVRCGRPDVLGMLIFSASAFFWASPKKSTAGWGLFCSAVLIPFVGLQYAFYMPVLLGVLFWMGGKPALPRLYAIVGGGIMGAILLCAYYQFCAGWDGLLASMADVHARRPSGLWANFQALMREQILRYYLGRPHFILLIGAAVLLGAAWKHLTPISRRVLLPALVMLLVPGVVIGLGSHFMAPYHWLAVAPALILLASAVSKSWENLGPKTKVLCGFLVVGLAASGRIVFVAMGGILGAAAYTAQIEKAATALVQPGQTVFSDPQLYYALKPRAARIYFLEIVPRLTTQEKDSVSLAFLRSQGEYGVEWLTNNFEGHWIHVSDLPDPYSQINKAPVVSHLLGWFHAGDYIGQALSVYRRDLGLPKVIAPNTP